MVITFDDLPRPDAPATAATTLTFFSPNYTPDQSFAYFSQTGTVTLTYVPGAPTPISVFILHQGGPQTPVSPGTSQYPVNAGDYLMIVGRAASCKIQFTYN